MRAIRMHSYGTPPRLDHVPEPAPPGVGEVTIDVAAVGVGAWDLGVVSGRLSRLVPAERLPTVLGAEFAGRVLAVGDGVGGLAVGERVIGNPGLTGAWAERLTVRATACGPAPHNADDAHAAALPVSYLTAWQALDLLDLPPGSALLILGAGGGVGAAVLQVARIRGLVSFATARAIDLERVRGLGVSGAAESVAELGVQVDGVVDLKGGESLRRSYPVVRPRGRIVSTLGGQDVTDAPPGLTVDFLRMRSDSATLGVIAALVDDGRLTQPIDAVYPFDAAGEALAALSGERPPGKLVLGVT